MKEEKERKEKQQHPVGCPPPLPQGCQAWLTISPSGLRVKSLELPSNPSGYCGLLISAG